MSKGKTRFKSVFLAGKFHGVFKSQDYYQSNQWIHLNNQCFVWSENSKLMKLKCVQLENVSRRGGREGGRKKRGKGGGRGQGRREGWCVKVTASPEAQIPHWTLSLGVSVRVFHVALWQKPSQYCKAIILQFSSVQSLIRVWLFATPWTATCQASLSITNSCPLSQWCHSTVTSSVIPFSHLQSFPASGSFQMSQFFASGGQSIGVSASASVFPMNIQDWFLLGRTGWILQSKGLSRVSSKTTVQRHQFFSTQLSL